jgi:hypothetical protein
MSKLFRSLRRSSPVEIMRNRLLLLLSLLDDDDHSTLL